MGFLEVAVEACRGFVPELAIQAGEEVVEVLLVLTQGRLEARVVGSRERLNSWYSSVSLSLLSRRMAES